MIEDRGNSGRVPLYSGNKRTGYLSACKAYAALTGERIRWPRLRAMLDEDRVLAARLMVAAHDEQRPYAASDGPSLCRWIETFLSRKRQEGKAAGTLAAYEQAGRVLDAALPGRCLASLTRQDGHDLRQRLVEQDDVLRRVMKARRSGGTWSANYIATILRRCRAILAEAIADKLIVENPLAGITVDTERAEEQPYVTTGEVAGLIEKQLAGGQRSWAAALTLARFAGARRGELLAVQATDVHTDRRVVTLPNLKTRKHKKPTRTVPLSDTAITYLGRCNTDGPLVRLTLGQAQQIKETLGVAWSWQALRSSWTSDAVTTAASPASYAAAAGHTPKVAAEHYWQARGQDVDGLRV